MPLTILYVSIKNPFIHLDLCILSPVHREAYVYTRHKRAINGNIIFYKSADEDLFPASGSQSHVRPSSASGDIDSSPDDFVTVTPH